MRKDMSKVLVERPRWGSRWIGTDEGRRYRDSEEVPAKQGMMQGYQLRKSLSENLNPLKRFIASQVNRPWDKVYSEICANIDRRNTVQEHIFQHMDQFVERHARLVDGKVYVKGWRWAQVWVPLDESSVEMYVHPRTGILLRNRHRKPWNWNKSPPARTGRPPLERRVVGDTEQLIRLEGIWYRVTLAKLPPGVRHETSVDGRACIGTRYQKCWDAVRNCEVSWIQPGESLNNPDYWFGRCNVYAVSKRQLSSRELKQYGLQQKGRDDSRPFCFGAQPVRYMLAV
jgi:hypothetical protein